MKYEYQEHGVTKGSELFLSTPSHLAEALFFYLHRCGRFVCTSEYRIDRQNFNNYFLFYVERGSMHIEDAGRSYTAQEGDMGIINCHMPHVYAALQTPTIFSWIHFSGSNAQAFYEHIAHRNQSVFHLPKSSPVPKHLHELIALHRQDDLPSETDISLRLHHLLSELLFIEDHDDNTHSISNPLLEQALQYIRCHYCDDIGVQDIANHVGLSPYHFSRLFKHSVGYSPHEYIVLLRLNAAKSLLKSTNDSIEEIADQVGYEYATSFSAAFTKKVGMTPKKFRDMPI